jgi:hypothetical protein
MVAERIVNTFAKIARPIMREFMPANSCIGAARTTIATMHVFNLRAVEIPVAFALQIPARKYVRITGFSPEERAELRARAADYKDEGVDNPGWNGHLLVLVENRWLLDPAIDQADAPDFGVSIPQEVFVIDTAGKEWDRAEDFEAHCAVKLANGDDGTLMYRKIADVGYRETEAWTDEGLPFLADLIALRVRIVGGYVQASREAGVVAARTLTPNMARQKQPDANPPEPALHATVVGAAEETPDQWADLVEYVLNALRIERRKRNDAEKHDDACAR